MSDSFRIREYEPERDSAELRECFVELQEYERALAPGMPRGDGIADAYLEHMFADCRKADGAVLVAEVAGQVAGFVCVLSHLRSEYLDADPTPHASIADLVVRAEHRGRGIGRALLREAEALARARGARRIRVCVLAQNAGARRVYTRGGYLESEIELEKTLG